VEKLRKALEKKAEVFASQKTKNTGCVNRKVLLPCWIFKRTELRDGSKPAGPFAGGVENAD
jgi:hypothetical protein